VPVEGGQRARWVAEQQAAAGQKLKGVVLVLAGARMAREKTFQLAATGRLVRVAGGQHHFGPFRHLSAGETVDDESQMTERHLRLAVGPGRVAQRLQLAGQAVPLVGIGAASLQVGQVAERVLVPALQAEGRPGVQHRQVPVELLRRSPVDAFEGHPRRSVVALK